ncbi:MAG: cytochrome c [Verrucomicrobiota bacterium]
MKCTTLRYLIVTLAGGPLLFATSDVKAHQWTLRDFDGVLSVGLEGHRDFANGAKRYDTSCGSCHALGSHGHGNAADLTKRALLYTPEELLAHVLNPAFHPRESVSQLDAFAQHDVLDMLAFVLSAADAHSSFFYHP